MKNIVFLFFCIENRSFGLLDAAIELIGNVVDQGVDVTQLFVDTVGDPDKYAAKIRQCFPKIHVTVSKKADSIYPIVSASSICAKVIRDEIVQTWKFSEFDEEKNIGQYGSGYPGGSKFVVFFLHFFFLLTENFVSDPQTKRFLNASIDEIFGFPKFVRFSWSTASTMIESKCIKVTW